MEDHPFSFCENPYTRKYSSINGNERPISRNSVANYVDHLTAKVKDRIKEELPNKFGVYFDGWTHNGEHYTAMFAAWTNKSGGVVFRLIGCGVQDLPEDMDIYDAGFTAGDYGDYFFDVLQR